MEKSVGKNIAFKFILNIFNIGIPIFLGPYIIRTLGAEMLGNINFAQSVFGYFFIFANFGVYQFAVRELSRIREDKERLSIIFTNLFCVTTLTTIITLVGYLITVNKVYSNDKELYLIFIIMSSNFISNIFYIEWANEALENYDFITIKTMAIKIIYLIIVFCVIKKKCDFTLYVKLMVLSTFFNNIVSYVYIKRKIKFNFKNLFFLKYIKPMFLGVLISNANVLFTQLDIILLGQVISKTDVAFYSTANSIMIMINTMMISIITVTLPRISNYLGNNDNVKYIDMVNKIVKLFFMILIPTAVGIFILSDRIMFLYGGIEFENTGNLLRIFAIYMLTIGVDYILANQVIYIQRKEKSLIKMLFVSGILNLVCKVLLIVSGMFNIYTAIGTTLIANIILILLEYYYVRKKMLVNISLFNKDILKYSILSLGFIVISIGIKVLNINWMITMILIIMLCSTLYFSVLIFTKDENIILILKSIRILPKNK
ncbi:oligosaccharide flippase family protein [Clostridium disporicum]|uniref:Polysaccharide transporter protein n=1 Tax=Clostridium disporicum TaxID=84024 RepID=A0A174F4S8_9CLOT|nr:oligosaccharide flippase family protein [Clostridium disporicum]CUO43816.1 polysaccharide transporter protein [Clostridium disporicum]